MTRVLELKKLLINTYCFLPSNGSDPSKFWKDNQKEYLALAQMAKDILSMPASSAPVERLFSIAGRVFTPL